MQNLTYGRKKPETQDDSLGVSGWMQALADNVAVDDAHTHDGTTSPRILSTGIDAYTTTTSTSWIAATSPYASMGLYEITLNMPTGRDFDKYQIVFKTSGGVQVQLQVAKVSTSSFKVYTNDNTANYTVLLLS